MSKPEGSTGGEGMVSDEIKAFLDFINESKKLYAYAVDRVTEEEKRQMDLIHAIELKIPAKREVSSVRNCMAVGWIAGVIKTYWRNGKRS